LVSSAPHPVGIEVAVGEIYALSKPVLILLENVSQRNKGTPSMTLRDTSTFILHMKIEAPRSILLSLHIHVIKLETDLTAQPRISPLLPVYLTSQVLNLFNTYFRSLRWKNLT